ncbi:MAG: LysM peptidoglycan-binding domain-containing protein [Phycisphaerae bacterium]|nr:LysM peptidoglycan-binding domain-containing protein [Phycisphaerae bacterium]
MTKETKIGLLVGLAFIILFAIILSEKGATRGTTAPSGLSVADATAEGERGAGVEKPFGDAGRLPVEPRLRPTMEEKALSVDSVVMGRELMGQPVPEDGEPLAPLSESEVAYLNQPVEGEEETEGGPGSEDEEATVTLAEAVAGALGTKSSGSDSVGQDSAASTASHLASVAAAEEARAKTDATASKATRSEPNAQPAKPAPKEVVAIQAVHKVQPGENLGKIAAKYYGRATPARIQAIFDANRDVLREVHVVRAEDELKIPAIGGRDDVVFESAPGFVVTSDITSPRSLRRNGPARIPVPLSDDAKVKETTSKADARKVASRSSPTRSEDPATFQWYEVRKNDTLSRIAQRALGNEKRFPELYRLNRDLISDKDQIKPGMKIRIPIAASVATDSQTLASSHGRGTGEP